MCVEMDWWAWRSGCYVLCSGPRMLFSISIDLCGIYPASFQNNVSKVGPLPYSATFKALYSNLVMKACDSCIKLSWWSFIHSFIPIYKWQLSLELICSNYFMVCTRFLQQSSSYTWWLQLAYILQWMRLWCTCPCWFAKPPETLRSVYISHNIRYEGLRSREHWIRPLKLENTFYNVIQELPKLLKIFKNVIIFS